jgi:hypothetical protein
MQSNFLIETIAKKNCLHKSIISKGLKRLLRMLLFLVYCQHLWLFFREVNLLPLFLLQLKQGPFAGGLRAYQAKVETSEDAFKNSSLGK